MPQALLVVDVQRGLVDALDPARKMEFLGTLEQLIAQARATGLPVVYVRHCEDDEGGLRFGTPAWQIASEIAPKPGDPIVEKRFADSFRETNLQQVLTQLAVEGVIVCGMQTEFCIAGTVRGAAERGLQVTLAADAHATYPTKEQTEEQIRAQVHHEAAALAEIVPVTSILSRVGL